MKKMATKLAVNAQDLPAYLQTIGSGDVRLEDNFDSSDMVLPRIALLQGTSEICKDFDEANPGTFWHTGLDVVLDPLRFVICKRHKRYLLQAPMADNQGILARADDAKTWDILGTWEVVQDRKTNRKVTWTIDDKDVMRSGLANWGTSDPELPNSPPAATMFYEYVVLLPDHLDYGMSVISLARSAIKKAKRGLNDKIMLHASNSKPMYSLMFQADVVEEPNDINSFYNWKFTSAGFVNETLYKKAKSSAEVLQEFRVHDEGGNFDDPLKTVPESADSDDY